MAGISAVSGWGNAVVSACGSHLTWLDAVTFIVGIAMIMGFLLALARIYR